MLYRRSNPPLTCHSCAGKKLATKESWRAAIGKRSELRWTPEKRERQSGWSRDQVIKQGGVPNAVKFTKGSTAGEKNHKWKGGITSENQKIRHSDEYVAWIKAVMARDNHTCQICQIRGGKLHAHHIKSFAKFRDLRYDVTNGLTACKDCHTEILHRGAWANEPLSIEEIREIQRMVADGTLSLDWEVAA